MVLYILFHGSGTSVRSQLVSACTSLSKGVFLMYSWREMSSMATLLLRHLVSLTLLSQSFSNSNFNKNEIMNLRFGAQYLVPTSKYMGAKMINQQHTCLQSDEKTSQILGFFSVKLKLMLTSTGYCLDKYYTVCNNCSVNVGFLYIVYHDSLMQSTNSPSVSQSVQSLSRDRLFVTP